MDKLITIIMPVYQAEKYLEKSINSVLNQTYKNWELILVDDGSTDSSPLICDDYARRDTRIRVFHKINGGQSSARNLGIQEAKGIYITFMDNDDIVLPEMYEVLVANIESAHADISACSYIIHREDGDVYHDVHSNEFYVFDNKEGMKAFLSREMMDIYVWTKLYKKDFLDRYQLRFEEGRSEEDFLFNSLAFIYAKCTVFVDRAFYIYNERINSACRNIRTQQLRKYLDDTWYRLMVIEERVLKSFPDLLVLAKRQTILYIFIMISVMVRNEKKKCAPYYFQCMHYLHQNRKQVIDESLYWGMSKKGVFLAAYLPSSIYFYYRKYKDKYGKS